MSNPSPFSVASTGIRLKILTWFFLRLSSPLAHLVPVRLVRLVLPVRLVRLVLLALPVLPLALPEPVPEPEPAAAAQQLLSPFSRNLPM